MKRIINGMTYNTQTAAEIFCFGPDQSDAWCGVYQTRHGVFFKIVVDHDGETVLEFKPLTDDEALAEVQKHRPSLVQQYFGELPEAGAAERRLTIRLPGNLADRLEAAAKAKGVSLNSYAMRCFEQCAAADGQPAGRE